MQLVSYHDAATADQGDVAESFRIADYLPERRRHKRRRLNVIGNACRTDNTLAARRTPCFPLKVIDLSEGGIAARSRVPVEAGERLSVTLPPEAGLPRVIFGRVSRCDARRDGWFLAIAFDSIPAA